MTILQPDLDQANLELLLGPQLSRQRGTKQSPAAKPVAKPVQEQPLPAATTKRAPVVILCSGGRYIDIYSFDRLDVQFLNVPETVDGLLAEQYAESLLPKRHREQFFPGYLRHRFEIERLTPSAIAERVARSEAIQRLRASGQVFTASQLQRIICGGIE